MPDYIKRTIAIAVLLIALPVSSQQGNLAGLVVMASGQTVAEQENGAGRQLFRRSQIFAGDTIVTGEDGRAQLRMVDSSLISLACNTAFKIEDYWYEESAIDDRVTLRLLSGRLRTMTGAIADSSPASYRFLVGEGRVEVRGTDFEVRFSEDGRIYFASYDGGITVANALGAVRLGIGGNEDFAMLEPGQAPEGLMIQPPQLRSTTTGLSPAEQQPADPCF